MIQGHLQGQISWSMLCKITQAQRLSGQQLLDLPNPNVNCLILVWMMLFESISAIGFSIQDQLQNLRWWCRFSIPYVEAKAR